MENEQHSLNGHRVSSDADAKPRKSRVPQEEATLEEIAEAAAQTGRAAESFLSSEPRKNGHRKSFFRW
jgi:hypothetical protein